MMIREAKDSQCLEIIDCINDNLFKVLQMSMSREILPKQIFDVFSALMRRFGTQIANGESVKFNNNNKAFMTTVQEYLLKSKSQDVKSRASLCMGSFAMALSKNQLVDLTKTLTNNIKTGQNKKDVIILTETLGFVVNAVQNRFAPFVPEIL